MSARADEIANTLMASIPSRLLEPHQLTHMQRCALAANAGCEMVARLLGDALEVTTKHEIAIDKEGARFVVYERRPDGTKYKRGSVKGK